MITSAKQEVQFLAELMKQAGVSHIVLSPGSRNAPLTIAFDEDPFFNVYVITDERSAAFYAMGMAQQLGEPVAIACTSGSAPLNYFPAVVEAYYQQIPLIVLTADRPTEWIDHGDGQTIRQVNAYGTHVLDFFQLTDFSNADKKWNAQLRCSDLIQKAKYKKGPVHINLPFSEPLYETVEHQKDETVRLVKRFPAEKSLSDEVKTELSRMLERSSKQLIIVGQKEKDPELDNVIHQLAKLDSVVVLTEHTSNIKGEDLIEPIDSVLALIGTDTSYYPDLILQVGDAIVSKRIKKYLRDTAAPIVAVDQMFEFADTFHNLYLSVDCSAAKTLQYIARELTAKTGNSNFSSLWLKAKADMLSAHQSYSESIGYSDFKVVEMIMNNLPAKSKLHFSNSSMIRYGLLFSNSLDGGFYCNRGTSGIDGCTSTAAGAALITPNDFHVLITGDLSFFYDSNALWNKHVPSNLRIIVVNNGGGDIFNIIPGPSGTNQRGKIFVAEHEFTAKGICESFDIEYSITSNLEELEVEFPKFLQNASNGRAKVLEINTMNVDNSGILKRYFDKLSEK